MSRKGGFYQPIDIFGQLFWIWWAILTMLGVIAWSETMYALQLWPILYLAVMAIIGVLGVTRRRLYLKDTTLFIGHILRFDYDQFDLSQPQNWQLEGQRLTLIRGDRRRVYWVNKRFAGQLKAA
ncbi:EbsA family protein [Lactobacillaceae bacterium L1_55_11]|nr:EbsA family protein [Lactobacillaceae bacterium L1_55_11]